MWQHTDWKYKTSSSSININQHSNSSNFKLSVLVYSATHLRMLRLFFWICVANYKASVLVPATGYLHALIFPQSEMNQMNWARSVFWFWTLFFFVLFFWAFQNYKIYQVVETFHNFHISYSDYRFLLQLKNFKVSCPLPMHSVPDFPLSLPSEQLKIT